MAVEFNEPTYGAPAVLPPKRGALVGLVMKLGLAKDDKQAQTALMVILVVVVALTVGVLVLGGGRDATSEAQLDPEAYIVN